MAQEGPDDYGYDDGKQSDASVRQVGVHGRTGADR